MPKNVRFALYWSPSINIEANRMLDKGMTCPRRPVWAVPFGSRLLQVLLHMDNDNNILLIRAANFLSQARTSTAGHGAATALITQISNHSTFQLLKATLDLQYVHTNKIYLLLAYSFDVLSLTKSPLYGISWQEGHDSSTGRERKRSTVMLHMHNHASHIIFIIGQCYALNFRYDNTTDIATQTSGHCGTTHKLPLPIFLPVYGPRSWVK